MIFYIQPILIVFILLNISLFANETQERGFYTAYKYKLEYSKLSKEQQFKIDKEYSDIQRISKKVYAKVNKTSAYKVRHKALVFEIWSNQFMKEYQPSEKELKSIYAQNNFTTNVEYKLKTLTLKDEKRSQSILWQLKTKKTQDAKSRLFEIFVRKDSIDMRTKKNKGNLGWVNAANLTLEVSKKIQQLKVNDVLTLKNVNGIQILYLEDIKEARKARYQESKPLLIKIAKQQALKLELKKLSSII